MSKQDNKEMAQKRRRLQAMQRSYIFLNEWRKNDVWVGNVVHYHKPLSDKDHSFIIARANASLKDKTLFAFDIGTGECLGMADDILALAGALSTKNLEIVEVDSNYYCPFRVNSSLRSHLSKSTERLHYSDFSDMYVGTMVLIKYYYGKPIPYLIGGSYRATFGFVNTNQRIHYLINLSNGVVEGWSPDQTELTTVLNDIADKQTKKDPSHYYPIILGTLN